MATKDDSAARDFNAAARAEGPTGSDLLSPVDLQEMLQQSSARTAEALHDTTGGLERFEAIGVPVAAPIDRLRSNPNDVVKRRLRRRGYKLSGVEQDVAAGGFEAMGLESAGFPGLERIIGRDMLMQISYLESGQIAARPVARVVIRDTRARVRGYGTGFMVSPNLLLTNNHVLPNAELASASRVEFNYQHKIDGSMAPGVILEFDPSRFFLTSPLTELDFTLVAVRVSQVQDHRLAEFGFHPLIAIEDEILAGECVTIIQHPKGDPKQIVLRDNEVLKLPNETDRFLHYKSGTQPGSSGSPVFNDSWEVVALHHSGTPETDGEGKPVTVDGRRWEPGMDINLIKWVANEGVRVAAIVKHVAQQKLTEAQQQLFAEALSPRTALRGADALTAPPADVRNLPISKDGGPTRTVDRSAERAAPATAPLPQTSALVDAGPGVVITVPLQISVRLGAGSPGEPAVAPFRAAEEAIEIDFDYGNREGYDHEFLGTGKCLVPLPLLSTALQGDAAVNRDPPSPGQLHELVYHHFSLVLNRKRRLAFFTAVNIDGRQISKTGRREKDKWFYDRRVDESFQIGNEFYKATEFDRGHLVRRLDPAWGRTRRIVKTANDDTFHFTNCSPQHKRFNEGKNLWAGLEDYLLGRSKDERRRLTVFTGPVFKRDDPVLRGVPIPLRFWKVAVMLKENGDLTAAGFLVSQVELVQAALEEVSAEEVARTFQVPIRKIEKLTGLDFNSVRNSDSTTGLTEFEAAELEERELESNNDIVIAL